MEFIDLKEQYRRYKAGIDGRIQRVLAHGRFVLGPEVAEVEEALAARIGVKHCITVASGTASLEIALRALGIGPGDEVVTVPYTWISTAEVIALAGARPVFVDIEAATYNIDVDLIEAALTPRTRAILPVSLFGQMPDYERINAMAARHGLPVIEDGAQSFGARQRGRPSCGVTAIGSTSFFPAKPLGCYGEGGALFTQDDALAEKMRAIRNHGGLQRAPPHLVGHQWAVRQRARRRCCWPSCRILTGNWASGKKLARVTRPLCRTAARCRRWRRAIRTSLPNTPFGCPNATKSRRG